MEKQKFIIVLAAIFIIVIIASNVELYHTKRRALTSIPIPPKEAIIRIAGMSPSYIYNSRLISSDDVHYDNGYKSINYIDKEVKEHISSKIASQLRNTLSALYDVNQSNMPVNDIVSAFGEGSRLFRMTSPTYSARPSEYRFITPEKAQLNAFIANNRIYVVKSYS